MSLQQQIHADMVASIKAHTPEVTSALRVALAEFSREPTKSVPDEQVIKILKKLVAGERELLLLAEKGVPVFVDTVFIANLESYLPAAASDDEIRAWILSNIDLSKFKNRLQAMRQITPHFTGRADGKQIKAILEAL